MKVKTFIKSSMWLVAVGLLTACASEDTQQKDETKQSETKYVATFTGHQPNSNSSAKSRTTATYTLGNPAQVIWEATDRIWVKADDGRFYQSEAANFAASATPADHSRANFRLSQGYYATTTPEVRYVGTSTNADRVTIATTQTQASPNDFSHLGAAGDCGTATAHSGALEAGDYEFTLQHKASYLCFVPRCMNTQLGPNVKLTKIVVTADKPIAGTYDFSDGSLMGKTPTGGSNTITLNVGGANDFSLNTTTENLAMNGAYMVIAPGTYNLTITYTINDPSTGVSMDIVKQLPAWNNKPGEIRDITANLTPAAHIAMPEFYMWDAVNPYWHGYENERPSINQGQPGATKGPHYPQSSSDPQQRWYHTGSGAHTATHSCSIAPNANEMCWYTMLGDPHWQDGTPAAKDGHLVIQPGGVWLKKKAAIIRDNPGIFPGNDAAGRFFSGFPVDDNPNSPTSSDRDWRTETVASFPFTNKKTRALTSNPLPNVSDYFFLPAAGYFRDGWLALRGQQGYYWSSSTYPPAANNGAYIFYLYNGYVGVTNPTREWGLAVRAFE